MLNKILVAVNIREIDQSAFHQVLSLAKSMGAKLMLLNVIAPDEQNYPNPFIYSGSEYAWTNESLLSVYEEQWAKFKQQGLDALRSLASEARAAGVEAEFSQDFGNPGQIICNLARTWSADLILVGSRGLTGVKEMFLGSVSNYVTHHAPCSVLIVRETPQEIAPRPINDQLSTSVEHLINISTSPPAKSSQFLQLIDLS
jgi:nucleotide-binding universal stress UspA family protein